MGMFDDIRCKYPLPVPGANDLDYQTKDTPEQLLDQYEIREDGTLWHENYDTEDHSELGRWMAEHPGQEAPPEVSGLASISGMLTRVNKRWEPVAFTGEICFYTSLGPNHSGWIEFSAYFIGGKINQLILLKHDAAETLPV